MMRIGNPLAICFLLAPAIPAAAGTLAVTDPPGAVRDFGNVSVSGPPAVSTVTLTNTGTNTTITGFAPSGGCTEFVAAATFGGQPVSPSNPAVLGNGASLIVNLGYDPVNRVSDACTYTVVHNGGNSVSFQVLGDGSAPVLQVTSPLFFADQRWNGGTPEVKAVTLTNQGEEAVASSNLQLLLTTGTHFSIGTVSGLPLQNGESATVQIAFDPTSAGSKSDTLTVALDNDAPADGNKTALLSGNATQSTQTFSASPFNVGSVVPGESATAALSLGNTGTAVLNIAGAPQAMAFTGGAAGDFSFTDHGCSGAVTCNPVPNTIDPGGSDAYALQCTPSAEGLRSITLTVRSDDPLSPRAVTVNCTGLSTTVFADGFESD